VPATSSVAYDWGMEIVIGVVILVIAIVAMGAAPLVRRTADAREQEMRARMPRRGNVDVNRDFKPPRDEGGLL
jgi:Ni/Co efflux regulator RcnB